MFAALGKYIKELSQFAGVPAELITRRNANQLRTAMILCSIVLMPAAKARKATAKCLRCRHLQH
ncbi:MAG: hypothetical protein M3Q33_04385 [Acidobacteriota bacterium]|nr:hypothetical protein [Acidobacteriota bacterium]